MSPDDLWKWVVESQRLSPYCYQSRRQGHQEAAKEAAYKARLEGEELIAWARYVEQKTLGMSNYTGD